MQELLERKQGLHRKILIVDDEFIEREMLGNMLNSIYEVEYAENGAVALDMIKKLYFNEEELPYGKENEHLDIMKYTKQ